MCERDELIQKIESDVWNAEAIADLILAHAEQIATVRQRNRELTRQVEQLQAEIDDLRDDVKEARDGRDQWFNKSLREMRRADSLRAMVDAAEKLAAKWRTISKHPADVLKSFRICADELASALTAPPSSSDTNRADTGSEDGRIKCPHGWRKPNEECYQCYCDEEDRK